VSIVVMICYARSGGTVLNQFLGSLPNTVMMSEVNPLPCAWSVELRLGMVKSQAKQWYGIELQSDDFTENTLELYELLQQTGRQLVIRDWSFGNFFPREENNFTPPNRLLILEVLEDKCQIVPFCFVRDVIDVWLSYSAKARVVGRHIDMESFFAHYLKYARAVHQKQIPVFKYEDFTRDPENVVRDICSCTGLKYSDSCRDYASYDKIIGDAHFDPHSRGRRAGVVRPMPRRHISRTEAERIDACTEMREANEIFGYPVSYYGIERENVFSAGREALMRLMHICWEKSSRRFRQ